MAICPAGPPKLMHPILNHTRNASPKLGEAFVFALDMVDWTAIYAAFAGQLCRSSAACRAHANSAS
jgi:hypothetical protein